MVELLTTIGIIAILGAVAAPVLKSGQVVLAQQRAMFSLKSLSTATGLYLADSDDTYPLGMDRDGNGGLQTWFGFVSADNKVDATRGALSSYLGSNPPADPLAPKLPFLGNGTGFGYNYETLGSDFTETRDFSKYPDCDNAAPQSALSEPSSTIAYATAVYFRPSWTKNGDDLGYEFGFLTPPWAWNGNPTMSFRHQGERIIDRRAKTTYETGNALVLFADGSAKPLRMASVTDKLFFRNPASFSAD